MVTDGYGGLQGVKKGTEGYKTLRGNIRGYRGFLEVTRGYRFQRVTKNYRWLQEATTRYMGLQGVAED